MTAPLTPNCCQQREPDNWGRPLRLSREKTTREHDANKCLICGGCGYGSDLTAGGVAMQVITAMEAVAGTGNIYHLLNDAETRSRCGAIQIETRFGRHAHQILTREQAEQQGLQPCSRCQTYADD